MATDPLTTLTTTPCDVIILAAGKGSRLKSSLPKVLHPLLGKPLLGHVIQAALAVNPAKIMVVVGHGKEEVITYLNTLSLPCPIETVIQSPQLGTGHALQQVQAQTSHLSDTVMLLSGDVPLLTADSLQALRATHHQAQAAITVLSAHVNNPTGYGRLLINQHDNSQPTCAGIVEEKDATDEQRQIQDVNAGVYVYHWPTVAPLLSNLSSENAQQELYATDLVGLCNQTGQTVAVSQLHNPDEMQGVNTRVDLARSQALLQQQINTQWMLAGVTIVDPSSNWISPDVTLAQDVILQPGSQLLGHTTIGQHSTIGPWSTLTNATVGNHTTITQSVVSDSTIGDYCQVGPFAHIRNQCELSHHVRLGNFVEAKATTIGEHSNAAHLSYLGNATLGSNVNMGAGSIIANYDPIREVKHHSTIGDGSKIGCNSVLVAPADVGKGTCVAAGSTITDKVNDDDLAVARSRQKNISHWVSRQHSTSTKAASNSSALST